MDITANFEPIVYSVDLQENIKEAGNVYSDYDDLANVPYGTKISVTAETNSGYTFDHWEIDGKAAGSDTAVTNTVDDDCQIKAFYHETNPKITAEALQQKVQQAIMPYLSRKNSTLLCLQVPVMPEQ